MPGRRTPILWMRPMRLHRSPIRAERRGAKLRRCRMRKWFRPSPGTSNEDWLLPVHLLPAVYWLRLEDATKLEGSIWEALPPLEIPFRVEA
eukprot:g25803.t1